MSEFRRRMRPALGTYLEIAVPEETADHDEIINRGFAAIDRVQILLNRHDPKSELAQLNQTGRQRMSRLSVGVLRLARYFMKESGGLFDCTIGNGDAGRPEDIEIHGRDVVLHRSLAITLDGMAKGLAVDLAIKALKKSGVTKGWVNAGGDLRVFGDFALPVWRREADGRYFVAGHLKNAALASSQVSEEPVEGFLGRIEHRSGAAPETGVWSVLAPSAWLADALTKVASLADSRQREQIVSKLGGRLILNATGSEVA